jgi:adenylate cyclase
LELESTLFKNTAKDIKDIGKELGVVNVLTGNLHREGDNLRVNVFLTKTKDRSQFWSQSYDEKYINTLDLQDNVSQAIAKALKLKFTKQNFENFKANNPKSVEAYEYYKLGEQYHFKYIGSRNEDDRKRAERMYKAAIKIDSSYALAYAGLADFYHTYHQALRTEEERTHYLSLSEKNIKRALSLNPNLGRAYTVFGYLQNSKADLDKAFYDFFKGVEYNPGSAYTNNGLAYFFLGRGLSHLA